MQAHDLTVSHVVEKLQYLSADRLAEVEDFIDFLHSRDSDRRLTRAAMQTAESAFSRVWDNDDDAVYDHV